MKSGRRAHVTVDELRAALRDEVRAAMSEVLKTRPMPGFFGAAEFNEAVRQELSRASAGVEA